jgi:hypothetical protein
MPSRSRYGRAAPRLGIGLDVAGVVDMVLALTARGVLEPRPAGTVPLDKAAHAYRAFRAGGHRGRWAVTG